MHGGLGGCLGGLGDCGGDGGNGDGSIQSSGQVHVSSLTHLSAVGNGRHCENLRPVRLKQPSDGLMQHDPMNP